MVRFSKRLFLSLFLALALSLTNGFGAERGAAQEVEPEGPVYIVQEGDSLWDIAVRFGVSLDDLLRVNGISDANLLAAGTPLVIPGLEGVQGFLTTTTITYGETLRSLSRRYQVPVEGLVRLNHLASPSELFVGTNLVIPQQNGEVNTTQRATLSAGQSLLELAVLERANPWTLVLSNQLDATWQALPADVLHVQQDASDPANGEGPSGLPAAIDQVSLWPQSFVQGRTALVMVSGQDGLSIDGSLAEYPMPFFQDVDGNHIGLQGVHAMLDPGLYPLELTGTLPDGSPFAFSQAVLVRSGNYPFDPVLIVSPETIDPAVTMPEDAQWTALAAPVTSDKLWDGLFLSPAPPPFSDCWPSYFGSRRSYNGSSYDYFHTGLDFCGGVGIEILAPADGVVVFAGPLTVRGNATMIDHGWGVYTGYMHQSEILVNVGDQVKAGQVIGLVGGTGRVTGPHLHWEVWVGGVQIDPMDWLEQEIPDLTL